MVYILLSHAVGVTEARPHRRGRPVHVVRRLSDQVRPLHARLAVDAGVTTDVDDLVLVCTVDGGEPQVAGGIKQLRPIQPLSHHPGRQAWSAGCGSILAKCGDTYLGRNVTVDGSVRVEQYNGSQLFRRESPTVNGTATGTCSEVGGSESSLSTEGVDTLGLRAHTALLDSFVGSKERLRSG